MTRYLSDLLDPDALQRDIDDGYVRARLHPEHPLTIFNYAEKTVYERAWTPLRAQCRGLIYDSGSGKIVARPWPKFFNYGEHPDGSLDLTAPVEVTDKADGSLGILVTGYGEPFLATRGSFMSEQAEHATALFRERYADWAADRDTGPLDGITYLFEIVYPENRIVLDYQGLDDLILLGGVEIDGGDARGPQELSWPGPRIASFPAPTLKEALELEPRRNAEGLVVRFEDGLMIKLKQEDYVHLHRIVTGLNARSVWAATAPDGPGLEALLSDLPDELHDWCRTVHAELQSQLAAIEHRARAAFDGIRAELDVQLDQLQQQPAIRPAFAELAKKQRELTPLMFLLLDGKRLDLKVWRDLKPAHDWAPRTYTEDTA